MSFLQHQIAGILDFLDRGNEGQHELNIMAGSGTEDGPDLRAKDLGLIQADANRPPAQERVRLHRGFERGREFVPPEVKRADNHGVFREGERRFHAFYVCERCLKIDEVLVPPSVLERPAPSPAAALPFVAATPKVVAA